MTKCGGHGIIWRRGIIRTAPYFSCQWSICTNFNRKCCATCTMKNPKMSKNIFRLD
nr:MAG TPA: hypothetical protein [Caudoviricetes sp.]